MPELGKKYTCYSCHTKFYDLGKPEPLCPKCGADQRDAEEAPVYTSPRRAARVVEEPAEEPDLVGDSEAAPAADADEEDAPAFVEEREEDAEEEEEEEEY